MTQDQINSLKDKLLSKDLEFLKDKELLSNDFTLKNPKLGFILAATIGICGIDRLYKGDYFLALIKFLFSTAFILLLLRFYTDIEIVKSIYSVFFDYSSGIIAILSYTVLGFLLSIIYFIELFAIQNEIRKQNYQIVLAYIKGYDEVFLFNLLKNKVKTKDMDSLKDKNFNKIECLKINFKSPIVGLMIGICSLGAIGLDRLYKGDYLLALFKISLLIFIVFYSLDICMLLNLELSDYVMIIGVIVNLLSLYLFIDCIFVYQGIKKDNFKKILSVIKDEN